MPLFRATDHVLTPVAASTFVALDLRERQDLQRLIRQHLDVFGEELLLVAEEYSLFEDSRRRVDLLALDRGGSLVVIELKRTDDGGHMELQALRYAAMVSTMSYDHMVDVYGSTHQVAAEVAREVIGDWLADADVAEQLPDTVRIVLAAQDFSNEVTTTVLWLNQHYTTDISCFRITPYSLGGELLLDVAQIIPLPEARDYQVQQRVKGAARSAAAKAATENNRDYTKYDVSVAHTAMQGTSKQNAVKFAVTELVRAGVDPTAIRTALAPRRWVVTHPRAGESVRDAFVREYPEKSTGYWFDLGMEDANGWWVMPRFGGVKIAEHLNALAAVAGSAVPMAWNESGDGDRAGTESQPTLSQDQV